MTNSLAEVKLTGLGWRLIEASIDCKDLAGGATALAAGA